MLISLFYTLNILLLLSCLLAFRMESNERRYSLSLVQSLLGLPLLAGEYFYMAYYRDLQAAHLLLFSENTFALIWYYMTYRVSRATMTPIQESRLSLFTQIFIGTVIGALAGYCLICEPSVQAQ